MILLVFRPFVCYYTLSPVCSRRLNQEESV